MQVHRHIVDLALITITTNIKLKQYECAKDTLKNCPRLVILIYFDHKTECIQNVEVEENIFLPVSKIICLTETKVCIFFCVICWSSFAIKILF